MLPGGHLPCGTTPSQQVLLAGARTQRGHGGTSWGSCGQVTPLSLAGHPRFCSVTSVPRRLVHRARAWAIAGGLGGPCGRALALLECVGGRPQTQDLPTAQALVPVVEHCKLGRTEAVSLAEQPGAGPAGPERVGGRCSRPLPHLSWPLGPAHLEAGQGTCDLGPPL